MADNVGAKLRAMALAAVIVSSIAVMGIPAGAAATPTPAASNPGTQSAAVETTALDVEITESGPVTNPRQGLTNFEGLLKRGSAVYARDGPETETIQNVEAEDASVTITSPTSDDEYARGAIIPIELEFENTDRGTITFGDRDAHNVEINVTVRDTDEDGTATVYLNTFQVGHGYVRTGGGGLEPNGFDPAIEESRNHGFFTHPDDDGSALEGDEGQSAIAHSDMDITGGSQGGAVMSGQFAYDLSTVAGEEPFTAVDQLDDRKQVNIVARGSDSVSLWTAPGAGVNAIDPETVDDIETGKAAGRITPADGVIAEGDYLVMEVHTEGLTGILHEAVLENDAASTADLFDREDDIITKPWQLESNDVDLRAAALEPADEVPANRERLTIDLGQGTVIGGTDNDGVNYETFYLTVKMEAGEMLPAGSRDLEPPQNFEATFEVRRTVGTEAVEDGFADSQPAVERFAFEAPIATIDRERVQYDAENNRIEVPPGENVTIPGITNVAAGSNLTVQTNSKSGQDSAFFHLKSGVNPRHVADRDRQVWEVTLATAFANAETGTEFEIKIRRQGAAGNINPGTAIDGIVLTNPEVTSFEFSDKKSLGDTIRIDEVETNQGGFVVITDADGNELGRSSRLAGDELHENVAVRLDDPLDDGGHDVTAVVYRSEDQPYPENSRRTATITVGEPTPGDSLGQVLRENPRLIAASDAPGMVKSTLGGTTFNIAVGGDRLGVRTNANGEIREVQNGGYEDARYRIEVSDSAASDISASERPMEAAVAAYENDEVSIAPGPGVTGIDRVFTGITLRIGELAFGLFG